MVGEEEYGYGYHVYLNLLIKYMYVNDPMNGFYDMVCGPMEVCSVEAQLAEMTENPIDARMENILRKDLQEWTAYKAWVGWNNG